MFFAAVGNWISNLTIWGILFDLSLTKLYERKFKIENAVYFTENPVVMSIWVVRNRATSNILWEFVVQDKQ